LLAVKAMGGESTEAWRAVLDDLIRRGLRRPEFLIVDGAPGLEAAIAAVWDGVPVQRCTVHKHRNLLAHAPERMREEITADYNDMIYAATREEIETRRRSSANGGSSIVLLRTALRRPTIGSSPSRGCRRANGAAFAPPTRSSGCTRSSSVGSRRRRCCPRQTLRRCCSGLCSLQVRSTCAKSMAGKRSPPSPSISQSTAGSSDRLRAVFSCAGAVLVRTHDGGVDHHALIIVIAGQQLENTLENTTLRPSIEALMDDLPIAKARRQITPRNASSVSKQNSFDEQTIVRCRPPT
jgi:hypothetical protein